MDLTQILANIPLKESLDKLVNPSSKELGELFGDEIRLLRFKSSLKTFQMAKEMLSKVGLQARPIDLKLLIPLLEHCSLEDEESPLIEKWAGLLATASSKGIDNYSYPHILNELSPKEVDLLDQVYDVTLKSITKEQRLTYGIESGLICKILKFDMTEFEVVADNLFRLNLCQPAASSGILAGDDPVVVRSYKIICMTSLGMDFVRVCRGF